MNRSAQHHRFSCFQVICSQLLIPQTFFNFPWRFELSGFNCMWLEFQSISTWLRGFSLESLVSNLLKIDYQSNPSGCGADIGRVQGPSALLVAQLLRSDLVELRPSQFSLLLRERAISRSDITNCAVRARRHIEIAIGTARYEPNLF